MTFTHLCRKSIGDFSRCVLETELVRAPCARQTVYDDSNHQRHGGSHQDSNFDYNPSRSRHCKLTVGAGGV